MISIIKWKALGIHTHTHTLVLCLHIVRSKYMMLNKGNSAKLLAKFITQISVKRPSEMVRELKISRAKWKINFLFTPEQFLLIL